VVGGRTQLVELLRESGELLGAGCASLLLLLAVAGCGGCLQVLHPRAHCCQAGLHGTGQHGTQQVN
jgi:hypothetical protein